MTSKTRAPRVRGARALVAMLPNGRSVWLEVHPALVSVRESDRTTAWIDRAYASRARALRSNAAAAQQLARIVKNDAAKLNRMRLRENLGLLSRVAAGDAKLEQRIDRSLTSAIRQARAGQQRQQALLRRSGQSDRWNQLLLVSGALLMAAYGQRDNPLAENNLVIGIAPSVWLLGDEISDLLTGKRSEAVPIWSYTAPFANLLIGWSLLSDRQHERFVTGTTDWPVGGPGEEEVFAVVTERFDDQQTDTYWATVDLSSRIAPEHLPDFQGFKDVPVLATLQSIEINVLGVDPEIELLVAEIRQAFLLISVRVSAAGLAAAPINEPPPLLKRLHVAWAVDTRKPEPSV